VSQLTLDSPRARKTRLRASAPTEVVFHTPLQTFLTFYLARTAFTDQRTPSCFHTQSRSSSAPLCSCSGARRSTRGTKNPSTCAVSGSFHNSEPACFKFWWPLIDSSLVFTGLR